VTGSVKHATKTIVATEASAAGNLIDPSPTANPFDLDLTVHCNRATLPADIRIHPIRNAEIE
jgi:hypothetical protein